MDSNKTCKPIAAEWAVFLSVLSIYFFCALFFFPAFLDDPFITFRYSKHLAEGFGIVWNPGEAPVEGYTSTLWVLMGALALKLNIFPILAAKFLGIISAAAGLAVIIFGTRRSLQSLFDRAAAALIFASSFDIVFYSVSAMENIVYMLLTLLLFVLLNRGDEIKTRKTAVSAALIAGAGCWIRPEAHALAGLLAAYFFLGEHSKPFLKREAFWTFSLLMALIVLPLDAARVLYYGDFFPNTYYAKHTGGNPAEVFFQGVLYLSERFSAYFPFVLLSFFYTWRNRADKQACFFTALFTVYFLYVLKVGGDDPAAFAGARLMLPVIPVLIIYSVKAIREFIPGKFAPCACAALLVLFFQISELGIFFTQYKTRVNLGTNLSAMSFGKVLSDARNYWNYLKKPEFNSLSKFFIENTPEGEAIAIPWAGQAPYETGLRVIDLLGLNDRHIGRQPKKQRGVDVKFDMDYVLARRPYFICETFNLGRYSMEEIARMTPEDYYKAGAWKLGQRALLSAPELHALYETEKGVESEHITCFRRKDS